ncbi:hypothetical protein [Streptomyces sp. bgisy060]
MTLVLNLLPADYLDVPSTRRPYGALTGIYRRMTLLLAGPVAP